MTFASRLLGFVREALIASTLGAGWVSDCFFIGFKLPNLARRLFAEGAISSLLVPQIKKRLHQKTATGLWLNSLFLASILILMAVSALGMLFAPALVFVLTGGFFQAQAGQQALTIALTQLMLPFVALTCLSAILASLLNALERFALASFTPVLLNLFMIAALFYAQDDIQNTAKALAAGVSLAGFVQLLWLWFACRRLGWFPVWRPSKATYRGVKRIITNFRKFAKGVGITALGQGALQLIILINTLIAARLLPTGSVSYLFFADRLVQLPIGVIGVGLSTALLPSLSAALAQQAEAVSEQLQNQALLLGLLLAIPACLCLMVLSTPVVQLSYQRGAFSAEDVAQTAHLLQLLAALIPVAVVLKILLAWLYARADIQIPMQITLITLAVHTLAAWFATQYWGLSGLAGATVVSLSLCLALLARRLAKQGGFKLTRATQRHLCQIGLASLGTAGYCWLGYTWVLSTLSAQTTWFALGLLGLILSALACYFGLCASFGLKLWILMHGDKRAS